MELFNKYKNKNFKYVTNYINMCINDDSLALTEEELRHQLSGASQSTFEEFILALTNSSESSAAHDASILYRDNNTSTFLPIRQISIPVRATLAEKAWLYYILQDSKADLFLDPSVKKAIIFDLESELNYEHFPIKQDYIDIRSLSPDNNLVVTPDFVETFKTIVKAIKEHRLLTVTNKSYAGNLYANQSVIPYKIEYSSQFDSFSLSCYPTDTKRPVKMNLNNLSDVTIGDLVLDYEDFIIKFKKLLVDTKVKSPVTIEILNQAEAYDRCAYLFSSFDTFCYEKDNNTLVMHIYYYRFQEEDIIRNILFLGHYVKVISPQSIVDKVISTICAAYQNYE